MGRRESESGGVTIKIALSAGHGGQPEGGWYDPGCTNGAFEEHTVAKNILLEVACLIEGKIPYIIPKAEYDTRKMTQEAHDKKCDYFINLHLNSNVNSNASYEEGYYWTEQSKAFTQALANSLGIFFFNNGIKKYDGVLGQRVRFDGQPTEMIYAFLELGFLSNPEDLNILVNRKREVAIQIVRVLEFFSGIKILGVPRVKITLDTQGQERQYALVGDKKVKMPLHLVQINDRNMVDLRFIVEALGGTIEWLPNTKQIVVTK